MLKSNSVSNAPSTCEKKLSYQDIITSSIGEFGLSQLIIVLACKLSMFISAWSMIMMSFAGAQPDWWSLERSVLNGSGNATYTKHFKKCIPNGKVEYDTKIYTIVSEWHLICDKKWIPTAISTTQMVGVLIGAAVTGQLGDWIGRRKSVILVYTTQIVFILIEAFAVNWQMMIICVFVVGFSLGGLLVIITMFMVEFVGTKWRTLIAVVPFWGAGVMSFGVMFKILPNWRHLCITTSALGAPIIILLWLVPESVRWLFGQGRYEEGKEVLKLLAKRNKLPEPDLSALQNIMEIEMDDEKAKPKYTYLTLIKGRSTRKKAAMFAFMWFYMTFGYYGLTLGVSQLAGDITLNMILMGVGEMICLFFVWLISKRLGRKYTTLVLMMSAGITSFAVTIAYFSTSSSSFNVYMNVFALVSRFFVSAAWKSLALFTIESFPTVIRSVAYGFASVFGRIGGIAGTQQSSLSLISKHLPFTINGVFGIISGLLCLFLQDTYHAQLEDYIEDTPDHNRTDKT